MGAPYEVASFATRSVADCFAATGHNTGNLLIGNGLVRQLKFDEIRVYSPDMEAAYINENFDRIIIPAANFLHPKFDFSEWSSALEKTELPVLMAGIGTQLPNAETVLKDIPEGTWRLVQVAAERSKTIGVRGYFTADALRKAGISNIRVTGCPSFYTNLIPSVRIRRPTGPVLERTVVNGSRNVFEHASNQSDAIRVERALFRLAFENQRPFVLQNERPEIDLSKGCAVPDQMEDVEALAKFFSVSREQFIAYCSEFGKTFFSVTDWFDWIKAYDFSIGTRFHGNLAALLNGVPAVVLVHDSRTRELCEFGAIPHMFIEEIDEIDVQALYENADYDLFEERYNALHRKYVEFLNENGVAHKLVAGVDLPQRGHIRVRRGV